MTKQRIDPVLVEKVAKAVEPYLFAQKPHRGPTATTVADIAIRVVFDELGLKEERRAEYVKGNLRLPFRADAPNAEGWKKVNEQSRLRSDWRPVEQGDTK